MINHIRPQKVTVLESVLVGEIEVSSIHFTIELSDESDSRPYNETAVFFPDAAHIPSDVVRGYDSHDSVVEEMKQKYKATIKS